MRSKASKLPIYRAGYNLAKLTTQLTKQFSRDLRATIGRRMQDDAILLVMDIYRANSSESKISEIESILGRLQAIELSFQLAFDLRQINSTALADAFDAIADSDKDNPTACRARS